MLEVNDSQHLQATLERIVAEVNKEAAKFGKAGLAWDRTEIGGRPYYALKSSDFGFVEVNYTYVNGYVVRAPTGAMVERSVRRRNKVTHCCARRVSLPACRLMEMPTFQRSSITTWRPWCSRLQTRLQVQQTACRRNSNRLSRPWLPICRRRWLMPTLRATASSLRQTRKRPGPFGLSPATLLGVPNALEIQKVMQQGMKK